AIRSGRWKRAHEARSQNGSRGCSAAQRNGRRRLTAGVHANRHTARCDISGEMCAKEVFAGCQGAELEATAFVRDRNRRRRPHYGNYGVRNRLAVVVFYGADDGGGRLRSTYDWCRGWLGLRRSEQWCAESDQTADCRRRHKSDCPCHIEL